MARFGHPQAWAGLGVAGSHTNTRPSYPPLTTLGKWNSTVTPIVPVRKPDSSRSGNRPTILVPQYCCGDDLRYSQGPVGLCVVLFCRRLHDSGWSTPAGIGRRLAPVQGVARHFGWEL